MTNSTFSPISGRSKRSMSCDDRVDVDDFQFQQLLAAEGQQLPGQSGGAVGGLLDGYALFRAEDGRDRSLARMTSAYPLMTISRLLKSCATPPASRPTASIFCAWRN